MIIVLMGPSGAGKSTVGRALAGAAGWPFHDADDLHPPANIAKMAQGLGLDDADREPWLARVRELILDVAGQGGAAVLACSALRERYRRRITDGVPGVAFVLLDAAPSVLEERLATRRGHFAGPAILDAQLADLEVPDDALVVPAGQPVHVLVAQICRAFALSCRDGHEGG